MDGIDGKLARYLVAYYGLVQVAHITALALTGLLLLQKGELGFLAPPPPEGWNQQALNLLVGTGIADAANACLSLAFVYGYFAGARWRAWLGVLTLTASVFSAIVYLYGTLASGAWFHNPLEYGVVALVFAPVILLAVCFNLWVARGANLPGG